ncbi:MAG: hypothetical protein UY09_C0034G0003 [Parcubacteria group bacterium GW2011_GWA2_47_8]|nr:MAG: hypothetical protein UY09_C0034G0003 [Parcubacteria group bacterium GW2011_GWA2_47_8]
MNIGVYFSKVKKFPGIMGVFQTDKPVQVATRVFSDHRAHMEFLRHLLVYHLELIGRN